MSHTTEYRVVGSRAVAGVQPGDVVRLGGDVNVEALIAGGHVVEAKPKRSAKAADEKPADDESKGDG